MTQSLTPDGTASVGSAWTAFGAATLHAATQTNDDGTSYAATGTAFLPGTDPQYMEFTLLDPAGDPVKHSGHSITARYSRTGVGSFGSMPTIELYEGVTLVHGPESFPDSGPAYTTHTFNLDAVAASNIVDYSDLRLRINDPTTGSGVAGIRLTYVVFTVPDAHSIEAVGECNTSVSLNMIAASDVVAAAVDCDTSVALNMLVAVDELIAAVDCDTSVALVMQALDLRMAAAVDCDTSVALVMASYADITFASSTICDTQVSLGFTKSLDLVEGSRIVVLSLDPTIVVASPGY